MGGIIRDFADPTLAATVKKYLLDVIMPRPDKADYRISETALACHLIKCRACNKREMALVFEAKALEGGLVTNYESGENHLVLNPGTRVVIGIHPEKQDQLEKELGMKITFGKSKAIYECAICRGMRLPERLCGNSPFVASLLNRRLGCDPIVDMRKYDADLGCFITVTEFPLLGGRLGRFMNLQTHFKDFVWILFRMGLVEANELHNFLARFPA